MAAENLKSTSVTNASASPITKNDRTIGFGKMMEAMGMVTPLSTAEVASTYRFCRVPSNCRLSQVLISAADFTTAGVVDIGLYKSGDAGGAVVDADFFASLVDLAAGSGAGTHLDVTNESGTYTVAKQEKLLWDAVGLTADPGCDFDIVATVTTAFNGGAAMLVKARYVV